MTDTPNIKLADIRTDGGTQPRATLDWTVVDEYAELITSGAQLPPVEVVHDGSDYWLWDGFHRVGAAQMAGRDTIPANIQQGTREDAQWLSYGANKAHGLRRSNDDKRRAVEAALGHPKAAAKSDEQIAEHCGVSRRTILRYRQHLVTMSQDSPPVERTVTRNGSTYTMNIANIGGRAATAADDSKVVSATEWQAPIRHESLKEQLVSVGYEIFICPICNDIFNDEVWHCLACDHHWTMGRDVCHNCWRSRDDANPDCDEQEILNGNGQDVIAADGDKEKLPHVSHNSGNNEWYTPAEYVQAAREVMGQIDLDPASSKKANTVVGADTFFAAEDDGLSKSWAGKVFLNPPYSRGLIEAFAEKIVDHYLAGDVTEAIVLVNNATETGWFYAMAERAECLCFPKRRVKFWSPEGRVGQPLQGQVFLYFGPRPERFTALFGFFGIVTRRIHPS